MERGAYYKHGAPWTPLFRARECCKLTQDQAAHALGVTGRTYRTWEKDPERQATDDIVSAFAAIADDYYVRRLREAYPSAFKLASRAKPATS